MPREDRKLRQLQSDALMRERIKSPAWHARWNRLELLRHRLGSYQKRRRDALLAA
jgi:hypothetical protein